MYYNCNDKPSDSRRWYNYGEEGEKCETCGEYAPRLRVDTHYFYTLDGWNYMSYQQCEKCVKKEIASARRAKRKKEREAREWLEELIQAYTERGATVDETKRAELWEIIKKSRGI